MGERKKKERERESGRIILAEPQTQSSRGTEAHPGPSEQTWLNAGSCLLNTNFRIKINVTH